MTRNTTRTCWLSLFLTASTLLITHDISLARDLKPIRCTVILDEVSGDVLHRDGSCDDRFTPASTFKLPLALMGYDTGILIDAHTPSWDYKPEFKRGEREQKTTDPMIWEKDSIVWYSQEITRRLGNDRFSDYVLKFDYGNKDISGDPGKNNGLTDSWLTSSLAISADEQAAFLRRALSGQLPLSEGSLDMMLAIVPHFETADGWDVQGKTGSGWLKDKAGKPDRNRPLGWFVGWAVKDERRVVFARLNIDVRKSDKFAGLETRDGFLADLPSLLDGK